jgi:HEAT repeat protein
MSRATLLSALLELVGPLGPFVSVEQRLASEARFVRSLDGSALDDLLVLYADPQSTGPLSPDDRDAYDRLLHLALASAGRDDPDRILAAAVASLQEPVARGAAIDLLGTLAHPAGCRPLTALLTTDALDDDELERVACSLGEIGTPEAVATLTSMRSQVYGGAVAEEVEIALDRARESGA